MEINRIIEKKLNLIPLGPAGPFNNILKEGKDDVDLIVMAAHAVYVNDLKNLFDEYYIKEMIELSNCYLGETDQSYIYLHLTKVKQQKIRLAVFYKNAHVYNNKALKVEGVVVPKTYTKDYNEYLEKIEKWRNTGKIPSPKKYEYDFRELEYSEFDKKKFFVRYYLKENDSLRNILRNSKTIELGKLAKIYMFSPWKEESEKPVRELKCNPLPSYPFVLEKDTDLSKIITEVKLEKGDIVEHHGRFYLYDEDYEVYAKPSMQVIRVNSDVISPEYLYLYLRSTIGRKITLVLQTPNSEIFNYKLKLSDYPIVLPDENLSFYKSKFDEIAGKKEYTYTNPNSIGNESFYEILHSDIIDMSRIHHGELIKKQLETDIKEINICYNAGAYKATLILAGSILEALLLDWISELESTNYFQKENKVEILTKKNKKITTTDLNEYIKIIEKKLYPDWSRQAKEADEIRKKRNLVHAKLCINDDISINDKTCKEIIEYLTDIIQTRMEMINKANTAVG